MVKITVIGAGNMGGALVKGWCKSSLNAKITVTGRNEDKLQAFKASCPGISTGTSNADETKYADIIVIAVKPWQVAGIVNEIRHNLSKNTILISVAAGIYLDQLRQMLDASAIPHLFYVIPNIAAEFGASMTFIAPDQDVPQDVVAKVKSLFEYVGSVKVCEEKLTHSGMLMASCGLAYIMRIIRAQTEAGVEMGFYPNDAKEVAMQTMLGAVALLQGTGENPEAAIDRVTTPGGYTIKGLNEMDHSGLNSAIINAFKTGMK